MSTLINEKLRLPVINGDVAVPDIAYNKRLSLANALITIPGSSTETIDFRKYFVLPEFERTDLPADWWGILRDAAI